MMRLSGEKHAQASAELATTLRHFIGDQQRAVIFQLMKGGEGEFFADKIMELSGIIRNMPVTYQAAEGDEAIVYLHYFVGGAHAWITEKDLNGKGTAQAFGLQMLDGDIHNAEVGYISIDELLSVHAELDLHWTPKTVGQVRRRA